AASRPHAPAARADRCPLAAAGDGESAQGAHSTGACSWKMHFRSICLDTSRGAHGRTVARARYAPVRYDPCLSNPREPLRGLAAGIGRRTARGEPARASETLVIEERMNAIARSAPDDIDALADRIAETAAILDAATHRLLSCLRACDEQAGWARQGALSCADWLGWRCGIALGAAREKLRVAHALARLPLIDAALRDGQISFSKVRAMTRIATPDNEANLLDMARHATAAQLEKICRLYRQIQPRDAAADEERRYLRVRDTDDGMVRIEIQLRPDEAARVLKACDVSAETRLDGLVAMAEATLRGDHPDRPPVEVLVHVDATTLTGRGERAGISAETARRLLCDAGIVPILEDAHATPLDVGRKTRSIPTALRRALRTRD